MSQTPKEPGFYWVKWAEGQDWDIGHYSGTAPVSGPRWWTFGTEQVQDPPAVVGDMIEEPK